MTYLVNLDRVELMIKFKNKKLKVYNIKLIKDYVDIISIALKQKASWHYSSGKKIKNKVGKMVNIDKSIGDFCFHISDCISTQYKNQRYKSKKLTRNNYD